MPWKKGNRLLLIREQEAPPDIKKVYEEIKESLGLSYVGAIFQVYAAIPRFLPLHWNHLRPIVQGGPFFGLCDRLRADAYTRAHNYFDIPDLCGKLHDLNFSPGAKEELSDTVEQFYFGDPLFLLIAVAQQQAFEGAVGSASQDAPAFDHPVFSKKPVLVDDQSASPEVIKIFEEMKRDLGLPIVVSDFRAIARWPDFLRSYWALLHPLLSSPLYQECQYGVRETAWNLARELPGPYELTVAQMTEAGMKEDDIASVVRLTQAFTRGFSGSLLNIALAKIGVEGGNHPEMKAVQEGETTAPQPSGNPIRAA